MPLISQALRTFAMTRVSVYYRKVFRTIHCCSNWFQIFTINAGSTRLACLNSILEGGPPPSGHPTK
jgi:hypothetical protein